MSTFVSIMETLMIILFGLSWPVNIIKAWKARTAKGTSVMFYAFIWLGYLFAIIGKFALISSSSAPWYETVSWYVMFFYFLNIVMVTIGIIIYFRNSVIDSKVGRQSKKLAESV